MSETLKNNAKIKRRKITRILRKNRTSKFRIQQKHTIQIVENDNTLIQLYRRDKY